MTENTVASLPFSFSGQTYETNKMNSIRGGMMDRHDRRYLSFTPLLFFHHLWKVDFKKRLTCRKKWCRELQIKRNTNLKKRKKYLNNQVKHNDTTQYTTTVGDTSKVSHAEAPVLLKRKQNSIRDGMSGKDEGAKQRCTSLPPLLFF